MPFETAPEIDLSSVGLITDAPAHSLNEAAWNERDERIIMRLKGRP